MTNFPCTLCGSRNWPRPDTDCPNCQGEEDEYDEDYEYDLRKERELDEQP